MQQYTNASFTKDDCLRDPITEYLEMALRPIKYLNENLKYDIRLWTDNKLNLNAFSNANQVSYKETKKLTFGLFCFLRQKQSPKELRGNKWFR